MKLLATVLFCSAFASPDWITLARRMGHSESDRVEALQELRRMAGLEKALLSALAGPNKYLALETVSALSLKGTLPDLIRLSDNDENGALHLTMGTLIDEKNAPQLRALFEARLRASTRKPVPLVVRVILLDTLGRFGTVLEEDLLSRLFSEEAPELRSAVLYYVHLTRSRPGSPTYQGIVRRGLADPVEEIRLRAQNLSEAKRR